MRPTVDDIRGWLMRGKRDGATHAIIVCDTFDWSDYPVYVSPGANVREMMAVVRGKNMQKVMEVYDLALPFGPQLAETRAWHVPEEEGNG